MRHDAWCFVLLQYFNKSNSWHEILTDGTYHLFCQLMWQLFKLLITPFYPSPQIWEALTKSAMWTSRRRKSTDWATCSSHYTTTGRRLLARGFVRAYCPWEAAISHFLANGGLSPRVPAAGLCGELIFYLHIRHLLLTVDRDYGRWASKSLFLVLSYLLLCHPNLCILFSF